MYPRKNSNMVELWHVFLSCQSIYCTTCLNPSYFMIVSVKKFHVTYQGYWLAWLVDHTFEAVSLKFSVKLYAH